MTARAVWFGPPERPLFGWVHVPEPERARGGVVLCPALGLEGVCAHRSYRHLAERLEAAGLVVVRFDYHGTGDSSGDEADPGRVEAWVQSVRAAVDLVREAGVSDVALVGLRVGAILAAHAAAQDAGVAALVLWDACASGRVYLREQRALGAVSLGADHAEEGAEQGGDGSIEVPGIVYQADTVAQLSELSVAATEGPLASRVLVLSRPDRVQNKAMVARLSMAHVEWSDALGQDLLLDVEPMEVREPLATMAEIVSWLGAVLGGPEAAVRVPARPDAVMADAQGHQFVERITSLGPLGLFGITTEPLEPRADGAGPSWIVLLNAGLIDHVGPSRLWVDLARRWAAMGARVLRFDLSGLGDSPTRPGQREDIMYPGEAFDDLVAVLDELAPHSARDVVFTGLCAGGYHSVEAGIALGVGRVCLINPILTAKPAEIRRTVAEREGRTPAVDPRRQATTARRRWVRALPAHDRIGAIIDRLPDAAWWLINRVAVASPPTRVLERLVEHQVDTYIVCGPTEARTLTRGEGAAMRRLARSAHFRLEVVPGIDHELFAHRSRELVVPTVSEWVLFGHTPGGRPPAEPRVGASSTRP